MNPTPNGEHAAVADRIQEVRNVLAAGRDEQAIEWAIGSLGDVIDMVERLAAIAACAACKAHERGARFLPCPQHAASGEGGGS